MKKLLLFLFLVGAALAGISFWVFYPRTYVLSEHKLKFATLQHGTIREAVSATGRLEPRETIAVSCEVPGVIVKLFKDVNGVVGEGMPLAELDNQSLRLDLEEASAALAQAKALKKAADLALQYQVDIEKKGGFRSERDQAEIKVEAAQAGVRQAETRLDRAKDALVKMQIRAPKLPPISHALADGKIGDEARRTFLILDRHAQKGQYVGPQGPPLFLLTRDLGQMELHTPVAEGDIAKVRKGLPVVFTVTGDDDQEIPFEGVVKEIRPLAVNNKGAVNYDTIVDVVNKPIPGSGEWRLRPGMTADVDIIRREHKNVWKIPSTALNFSLEEAYRSAAARQHLADWQQRDDAKDWQAIWIWNAEQKAPWPVFIRLVSKKGEPGLKDADFNEILEWEPGHEPDVKPPPSVIIEAPPARSSGFFDQPMNIKVS